LEFLAGDNRRELIRSKASTRSRRQPVLLLAGLGTDIGATALSAPWRFIQKLLGSVTGRGIVRNIADCYAFIINHYEPGDRVFLIGFSRGAYTVRSIANLLMLCGVPTTTPSGPLMRFRKQVDNIAMEAVTVVLEHGAGHLIVLNEEHLRRILAKFSAYYNGWRPHVSLGKDAPEGRPIDRFGDIVAYAILGGLHHRYARI
jgi:transposase InsO family protein